MRLAVAGDDLPRIFRGRAGRAPEARQALLRHLAIQTERTATALSTGSGAPGSYPIPVHTGFFRRGFGFELKPSRAIVFNSSNYARALHDGYRPYGNAAAMPISPRPYFDDAQDKLDIAAAGDAWEGTVR